MQKSKKRAVTGFFFVLLFILAFSIFFALTFRTVVVKGVSMDPTLQDGERVLVSSAYWLVGPIRKKDIVVMEDIGRPGFFIKRVLATEGETVDWMNMPESVPLSAESFTIPAGMIYVIGDNRSYSDDSRRFGPIEKDKVIGKVVVRP